MRHRITFYWLLNTISNIERGRERTVCEPATRPFNYRSDEVASSPPPDKNMEHSWAMRALYPYDGWLKNFKILVLYILYRYTYEYISIQVVVLDIFTSHRATSWMMPLLEFWGQELRLWEKSLTKHEQIERRQIIPFGKGELRRASSGHFGGQRWKMISREDRMKDMRKRGRRQ